MKLLPTKDVTAATNPRLPPTHNINGRGAVREMDPTPSRQPKIQPPKMASGFSKGIHSIERNPTSTYTLPDKVSQKEILDGSFKYGGGRSAGNRSLADNIRQKINQP